MLIYSMAVGTLVMAAFLDHKTRINPSVCWWLLVALAAINYFLVPWAIVDITLIATVTVFGAAFWWIGAMGQADILVLVAAAAIEPRLSVSFMAWSVIALGGMIPTFFVYHYKQKQVRSGSSSLFRDVWTRMRSPENPMMPFFLIGFIVAPVLNGAIQY